MLYWLMAYSITILLLSHISISNIYQKNEMNKFIFTITNHCFLARIIKVPFYRLLWCLDMIISVTTVFHYFCSENICIIAQKIFIVFVLNLVSIKEMPSCMSHEKCYVKSECMFDALVKNFIYNIWVDPYGIFNVVLRT